MIVGNESGYGRQLSRWHLCRHAAARGVLRVAGTLYGSVDDDATSCEFRGYRVCLRAGRELFGIGGDCGANGGRRWRMVPASSETQVRSLEASLGGPAP